MNTLKKIYGKILYGLGRVIDIVLGLLIDLASQISKLVGIFGSAFRGILAILALLIIPIMLLGPFGIIGIIYLLPLISKIILILLLFGFIMYMDKILQFIRYTATEYLYDRSNYYIDNTKPRLSSLGDYAREYINIKQKEREEKTKEEFKNRYGGFNYYEFRGEDFSKGGQGNNFYGSTNIGFKEKYEDACNVLEVPYSASPEEIKSAYRKKAKMYHPDLNKSPDATVKFQKINEANEMLSEENINRYKSMS